METIKNYRIYYIIALLIVAVMTIISHVLIYKLLKTNDGFAYLINISGRQRMLSQKIANLSILYSISPSAKNKQKLLTFLNEFKNKHKELSTPFIKVHSNAEQYQLTMHNDYFKNERAIDPSLELLNNKIITLFSLQERSQLIAQSNSIVVFVNKDLLPTLDKVVMNYQKESELRIEEIDRYQWALLFIILLTLLIEGMYIFRPLFRKLIDYMLKLTKMASIDELTGLLNRRVFNEKLAEAYALVKRYNNDYTIVMFDIDNFKNINDTYGHSAGDEAIKSVASIILNHSRNTDYCFRTGGEEFIVLLPQTGLDDAIQFAERCRESVQNSQHSRMINTQLTLSGGVAEITKSYNISPLEQVDKALYRAKFIGRNVIVKYENNWDLPSEELT